MAVEFIYGNDMRTKPVGYTYVHTYILYLPHHLLSHTTKPLLPTLHRAAAIA